MLGRSISIPMEAVQGQIRDIARNIAQAQAQNNLEIRKIVAQQQKLRKNVKECSDKIEEVKGQIHICDNDDKIFATLRRQEALIRRLG